MLIKDIQFYKVCEIRPEMDLNGAVKVYMPQSRYENKKVLPLSPYGKGPFCKFKIPIDIVISGVYVLVKAGAPKYIGECINLSSRYNTGYGNISPRNCFKGGQDTNCRINNLIYESIQSGNTIELWFHETLDYKHIESRLRSTEATPWNKV